MHDTLTRYSRVLTVCAIVLACLIIVVSYKSAVVHVQALDIPTIIRVSICGDGLPSPDEVCDDGTALNIGGYGSTTFERHCNANCQSFDAYCGDGILQVRYTEECDDGNSVSGDLCSNLCREEEPVYPRAIGAPPRGSVPQQPLPPGAIPSELLTRVIVRGKAFPNSVVNILLDGKAVSTVNTDSNADFVYSANNITPGITSMSFNAKDRYGNSSITTTSVFEVVQSAITTVTNILIPPTIAVRPEQIPRGAPIILFGQSVPLSKVTALLTATSSQIATVNGAGDWSLELDTSDLEEGSHTAKAYFRISDAIKSGFGRSVSFTIGAGGAGGCGAPDMNADGKVNLVDFSIFLLSWNTTETKADFNCDGKVNLADFSIMLYEWTG